MNKINLPFTINNFQKGGNSFKILNESEINKNKTIINIVKKILIRNSNKVNSNKVNSNKVKINYIRGSTTKEYYNKK
jgi:hypothetical protein